MDLKVKVTDRFSSGHIPINSLPLTSAKLYIEFAVDNALADILFVTGLSVSESSE